MKMDFVAACVLSACVLTACKEPRQPADFTPGASTTTAPAAHAAPGNAPVELTLDERRVSVAAGGRCNLERINGAKFAGAPVNVSKASPIRLSGWLADADAKSVPASFDIRMVNTGDQRTWKFTTQPVEPRADVQALLGGDAALANTGYMGEMDVSGLPDGTYRVYTVFSKNGATLACDNGRALIVGP
jgi:hypothetical protein